MRRTVAVFALAALSWSQLVALRCDMGAPAPLLEAGPRALAYAHAAGDLDRQVSGRTHQPAPPATGHHPLPTEGTPAAPHGEHHRDAGGCLMILAACGAASARTVQAAILVRFPAVSVRANLDIAPIPVAVSVGVETPPPRHHA